MLLMLIPLFVTHCIFYLRFTKPFLNGPENYSRNYHIAFWVIMILLYGSVFYIEKFGNNNINSLLCRREIDFLGYVFAFPDSKYDKNYHLKADIKKIGATYEVKRIYSEKCLVTDITIKKVTNGVLNFMEI